MAKHIRCTATFPHSTGLPEDAVVNTWAFSAPDGSGRDVVAGLWTTALNNFYGTIKNNLSSAYAWNSGTYEYIDMADGKPRVPFQTDSAALGSLSTSGYDLGPEFAICLSFRGSRGSGLNAKRRRGRVFLGPLQIGAVDQPGIAQNTVDAIAAAGNTLKATAGLTWSIYSPYTHHDVPVGDNIRDYPNEVPAKLDDAFVPVDAVWVDNAWDVQRRRGTKATYRKTY